MSFDIKVPRKLIEVALPLDAINAAAAREKSIRHGHPSTIHLWWARRPLAAARAVLFCQIVNDPEDLWRCQNPGVEPKAEHRSQWNVRRTELFRIIEELVKWENTTNGKVLEEARKEISQAWKETCELNKSHPLAEELFNPEKIPGLHDPFAGGVAIPLEAQRLGLNAYASDLNPVAVLINKATIEIPPKFAGRPPIHSRSIKVKVADSVKVAAAADEWAGGKGLADDVRHYGRWVRDEAFKRVGRLYPPVKITKEIAKGRPDLAELVGQELTVIAWLWARTVSSPNPAYSGVRVPLASTFVLSSKDGNEAYVEPAIGKSSYTFKVKHGVPPLRAKEGTKAGRASFRCIFSGAVIDSSYIRTEARSGRMGVRLMAIVAAGPKGRVYLPPVDDHLEAATAITPTWKPDLKVTSPCHDVDRLPMYGMYTWGDAFTSRQLATLTTLCDLVAEARTRAHKDAVKAGLTDDDRGLDANGTGARAYAEAVSVYLACAVSKTTNIGSSLASWMNDRGAFREAFARQALPMVWDFAEANTFADAGGSFDAALEKACLALEALPATTAGHASQLDAATQTATSGRFVSTDPPYYDNIGYAELSDFFYVWLRPVLRSVFPQLFATIATPKAEELIAAPYRHGGKSNAEKFFLDGMTLALRNLATQAHPAAPITIYYAFRQSETEDDLGTSSTGWETFLEALIRAGFALTGTWPMRTEGAGRLVARGTNALASSIILVCRHREKNSGTIDRRKFQRLLNETLPAALATMTRHDKGMHSPVAPVDLSQAIIGPGMAIFSRYDAVLEANGSPMTVKTALQLINRFLAGEDFDSDTQFCLHWFESHCWNAGKFGEADVLARAKGTGIDGLKDAGVLNSASGSVRLFRWDELPSEWAPETNRRISSWEVLHHLIHITNTEGERSGGAILATVQAHSEAVRALAYRLYTVCERRGWAAEASAYNNIVLAWDSLVRDARHSSDNEQDSLIGRDASRSSRQGQRLRKAK